MKIKTTLFDDWWADLLAQWSASKDGYDVIDKGSASFLSFTKSDKEEILNGLIEIIKEKQDGDILAIEIIRGNARASDLDIIEKLAEEQLNYKNATEESYLVGLLRILVKGALRYHKLVNLYLYKSLVPNYFSAVQWSFWPEYPDEFTKAYSHYLSNTPSHIWAGTAIVQAFMNEPDAVGYLETVCRDKDWWSDFAQSLLEQTQKGIWPESNCQLIIEKLK